MTTFYFPSTIEIVVKPSHFELYAIDASRPEDKLAEAVAKAIATNPERRDAFRDIFKAQDLLAEYGARDSEPNYYIDTLMTQYYDEDGKRKF